MSTYNKANRYVIDTHYSVSLCAMAKESFNLLCTEQLLPFYSRIMLRDMKN